MLRLLHIENVAVIEEAEILFERGFNVLRQVAEPEVCERAATGADQMVVARGVVVAVGRAGLRQAGNLR